LLSSVATFWQLCPTDFAKCSNSDGTVAIFQWWWNCSSLQAPITHTINLSFVAWQCKLNVWRMLLYFLRRNMAIVNHRHIRPLMINLDFNAMVIDEHHHKECGMFAGWTDGFQQLVDGMTGKAWRNPPRQLKTWAMLSQFQWLYLI
jgi:hypothetical protein